MKPVLPFASALLTAFLILLAGHGSAAGEGGAPPATPEKPAAPALATRSYEPPPDIDYRTPARTWVARQSGNWTINLESELVTLHAERADRVTARLGESLEKTLQIFPAHARTVLEKLPVFVLLGPEATGGGRSSGAEYFSRRAPDFYPHLHPDWHSAVVIYSADNYLRQTDHWAVQILIHELAHAWHLEQWPEKQPEIFAAWQHAMDTGLYRGVKDVNGTVIEKAYAAQNQLEYFAELSCAWFSRGEYEPFDRAALLAYDPVGAAMLGKMWGTDGPPPPPSEER